MKRKKVKFNVSIGGLGDPDRARLDERYEALRKHLLKMQYTPRMVENQITEQKRLDRYDAAPIGFKNDWSFRPGEVADVPADLAEKWVESEICSFVEEPKKAAA